MRPSTPPSVHPVLEGGMLLGLWAALVALNPWGKEFTAIWNSPREVGMGTFVFAVLLGLLLRRNNLPDPPKGNVSAPLWASVSFLAFGLAATVYSPQPIWSWTGYPSVGDGLRFWALGIAFAWSTYLALETGLLKPRLLVAALLLALGTHALAIFPQLFDWKLDYTQTSGQTYVRCFDLERSFCQENPNATASGIHRSHMPIGLTSHRGHAAGALALLSLFVAGLYVQRPSPKLLFLFALGALALWFTQTRGGWMALWGILLFLVLAFSVKRSALAPLAWHLLGIGLLTYGVYWGAGKLLPIEMRSFGELGASFDKINTYTSGRLDLWQKALTAFPIRPLLGWGFDGYARAYPYGVDWNGKDRPLLPQGLKPPVQVVLGEDRLIYLEDRHGLRILAPAPYAKAHNLFLDLLLSVGILGGISYLLWLGLAIKQATWPKFPLLLVLLGYLLFGFTWYDSIHVTPIALLALGASFASETVWLKKE